MIIYSKQVADLAGQLMILGVFSMAISSLLSGMRAMLQQGWLPMDARVALNAVLGEWYVKRAEIEAPEGDYERLIDVAVSLYTTRATRYGWATPAEAAEQGRRLKEKALAELERLGILTSSLAKALPIYAQKVPPIPRGYRMRRKTVYVSKAFRDAGPYNFDIPDAQAPYDEYLEDRIGAVGMDVGNFIKTLSESDYSPDEIEALLDNLQATPRLEYVTLPKPVRLEVAYLVRE